MRVTIQAQPVLAASAPEVLFKTKPVLMIKRADLNARTQIHFVLNWAEELGVTSNTDPSAT